MLTFPVAVQINGEIRCIQHIEIYADMGNCWLYAADAC